MGISSFAWMLQDEFIPFQGYAGQTGTGKTRFKGFGRDCGKIIRICSKANVNSCLFYPLEFFLVGALICLFNFLSLLAGKRASDSSQSSEAVCSRSGY